MERKLFVSDLAISILKDELVDATPEDYAYEANSGEYYQGLYVTKDDMDDIYIGEKDAEVFYDAAELNWK